MGFLMAVFKMLSHDSLFSDSNVHTKLQLWIYSLPIHEVLCTAILLMFFVISKCSWTDTVIMYIENIYVETGRCRLCKILLF